MHGCTHRALLVPVEHLDLELTNRLSTLLYGTSNFGQKVNGGGLGFGEDVNMVGGHTLLRDQNLF